MRARIDEANAEIEQKYGEQLKSYNEAQAKAKALSDELNQARKEYRAALDGQKIAEDKMAIEINKTTATLYELGQAYEKAQEAADKEAEERQKQTEDELKFGERRRKWRDRITNEVRASEEEYLELQKAANDAIEEGLSDAKVEKELRAKWLQIMDERNKAEEEARKKKEEGRDPGQEKQQQNASMSVSLDKGSIDGSADENSRKTEKVMKFGEWKRQQREEQRKIRDRNNSIRTNQPQMMKYLKGEMDKQERENWKNFIG